jgi:Holliday junction resolvasome RuvABC endonuclease subunit
MIKRVLGLDISSTTTGYCLLEWNDGANTIKLKTVSYFKPIKEGSILERLRNTRDRIADIINELRPDYIGIEDIITFMPHRSSANTIITLAVFNRMIGLLSFDYTGKEPSLYNVMDIRRGLQYNNITPDKEDMPELVAKHLGITFPWQYNAKGKPKIENGDMADAMAVALFHTYVLANKVLNPIDVRKKKKLIKQAIKKKRKVKRKR